MTLKLSHRNDRGIDVPFAIGNGNLTMSNHMHLASGEDLIGAIRKSSESVRRTVFHARNMAFLSLRFSECILTADLQRNLMGWQHVWLKFFQVCRLRADED